MKRNVLFTENGAGYHLEVGDKHIRMNHAESREVLCHILAELPGIPGNIRAVWELAQQPHLTIYRVYKATEAEVVCDKHYGVVTIGDSKVHTTSKSHDIEDAIDDAADWLGIADRNEVVIEPTRDDLSSKMAAEQKLEENQLAAFMEEHGFETLHEVAVAIQKGDV